MKKKIITMSAGMMMAFSSGNASYYTSSSMSTYLGSSSVGHFWSATPWNYSYPAPCRTLVNTYPA